MQAQDHNARPHYTLLLREEDAKVRVYVEPANVLLYEADSVAEAFSRMDRDAYSQAERIAGKHAAH